MSDSMLTPFNGRTAVVTGGASGIGAATAKMLANRGASVVVSDINLQAAEATAESITVNGGRAWAVPADVTCEESMSSLMDETVRLGGAVDILVANAGIAESKGPIHELDLEHWRQVLDINLTGVALSLKHALRHMSDQGSGAVVALSSILGIVGQATSGPYSAAKSGVSNLVRSVGLGYADTGIRVNAVAPGYVQTPLVADLDETVRAHMLTRQPMGRLGTPNEVAEVICFLASDAASFVTAAVWSVDGGYVAQ